MSCKLQYFAAVSILLASSAANAIPFASFDARSMAMGGAGVAVGGADAAPLFNPSLLSVAKAEDDFSLVFPTLGLRVADPDKLIDGIDSFQNGNYVNNLSNSISALNTSISTPAAPSVIQANALIVSNDLAAISTQLTTLSDKPITVDGGLATVIGIPGKKLGVAFYANGAVAAGGQFMYPQTDKDLINTLIAQAAACSTDPATCSTLTSFDSNSLTSGINFRGVSLNEFGFAFSREFQIFNQSVALGITPKMVNAQLFDAPISVSSSNQTNVTSADYLAKYSFFNFDLGATKSYNNGWTTALVIKNIIPQTLDFKQAVVAGTTPTPTGDTLSLNPQARIGVAHSNSWSTVALDFDLTRNDPAGMEKATQYIALGGELSAWGWAQLRAGYRIDLVNKDRNVTSVGLGLAPFGVVHFDLAVAGNANEYGASFQFGVHF